MRKLKVLPSEWTCLVRADEVTDKVMRLKVEPSEYEREDLARRLGVTAIESLTADIVAKRDAATLMIHVKGRLKAKVVQDCVITLEPIASDIAEEFDAWYAGAEQMVSFAKGKREQEIKKSYAELEILADHEDPETIVNGNIDIGELVTQYLSLGINPYPHKPGARYEYGDDKGPKETPAVRKSPFEALKQWKERR